jgi:serine/threonine protein kinase
LTSSERPLRRISDADADGIDLLSKMLQFNPNKRCTVTEAIEHKFFESIRKKQNELKPEKIISMDLFESGNVVDLKALKLKIFEEVEYHRTQWEKERAKGAGEGRRKD